MRLTVSLFAAALALASCASAPKDDTNQMRMGPLSILYMMLFK